MKKVVFSTITGIALILLTSITPVMAQSCMLSEIRMFAGQFTPKGWAETDGQLLNIAQHPPLFELLGITYGGDGRSVFALPKMKPSTKGVRYIICMEGIFPSRQQ